MKQSIIIKVVVVLAIMFSPSFVMADKIEVQDNIIIIVGKGQTNKKGVFSASDSICTDSILIDEIALTYVGREKHLFEVVDSASNKRIFSHVITNGMTNEEMKGLSFLLLAGHNYIIWHGEKRWNIKIHSVKDTMNEGIETVDTVECKVFDGNSDSGKRDCGQGMGRSCLIFIFGIVLGAGSCFLYFRRVKAGAKLPIPEPVPIPEPTPLNAGTETITETITESGNHKINIGNKENIDKQNAKKRLVHLKRIAISLGLQEGQIPLIDCKIQELQQKLSQTQPSDVIRDEISKELWAEFVKQPCFKSVLLQTKIWSDDSNSVGYYKKLQCLISEISKKIVGNTLNPSDFGKETVSEGNSESHTQWLGKRLKELFEFTYNEKEPVEKNIKQLFRDFLEKNSADSMQERPVINIEEVLKEAKSEWEVLAQQEKAVELAQKDNEVNELKNEVNELKEELQAKDNEIRNLNSEHEQKRKADIETLIGKFRSLVSMIEWRPMLDPCSDDDITINQCNDIENRFNEMLEQMKTRLCELTVVERATWKQVHRAIQEALVNEINANESVVNSLCRLYAYSQLPFMTDRKRVYGVRLRRKNIQEVYEATEELYIQFGIKILFPSLFVMEFKDGDFENVTGQVYSELGNLCPNVNNHCDNIDSEMKLKDIVVDIDRVGYAVDGSVRQKARILTY